MNARLCRPALAAALLAVTVLFCTGAMASRGLQQSTRCHDQQIDKYFFLNVSNVVCSFYRPGNLTERGPNAFNYGTKMVTDCIVVNNTLPGPTLRVNVGDWVRVDIQSYLIGREISFHWHGLRVPGTPWADGATMINSCPIAPGMSQSYVFQADEAGLYFYHGHGGLEEEYGMSGALVVEDPNDPYGELYDEELHEVIELRDWWWAPDSHVAQALAFRFYQQLAPHGIPLMNGLYGNGSDILPYPVINLATNTCYRTKWICGNTEWPGWFVSMTDENNQPVNMTMITLTGDNIQPVNTHRFAFYIAQRAEAVFCTGGPGTWNVLLNSSQPESGYCTGPTPNCINGMTFQFRVGGANATAPKTANRALLQTYPFHETWDSLKNPEWVVPFTELDVAQNPTQTWEIYTAIVPGNMYAWTERNWGLAMPTAPPLFTNGGRCGTPPEPQPGQVPTATRNKAYLKKTVRHNEVVDIIINNLSPFYHPMHIHGNDFIVLGSRYYVDAGYSIAPQNVCPNNFLWAVPAYDGIPARTPWPSPAPGGGNFNFFAFGCPYNASEDNSRYYLEHPYRTDTVPVPAHGWTHVRIKFDNPGIWYMHCHLTVHMLSGMGFVIHAGVDQIPRTPSWVDTSCGGACMAQRQICGDYAPTRSNVPQCSAAQDTCPPRGGIFGGMMG